MDNFINKYTTETTKILRNIEHILESIDMDPKSYSELVRNKIYIHPQCSLAIQQVLQDKELPEVQKVLANDYNSLEDVQNMCDALDKMCDNKAFFKIFAVDAFQQSSNLRNYIDHLARKMTEDQFKTNFDMPNYYIDVVRYLYQKFDNMEPLKVHETMYDFINKVDNEFTKAVESCVGTLVDEMRAFVKNRIEHESDTK